MSPMTAAITPLTTTTLCSRCIGDATVRCRTQFPTPCSCARLRENVPVDVTFRGLTDDDLPLLHRWLNEPGVVRWWEGDDVSWEGVVRDYGSGREPDKTEFWIASADGRDV